MLTDACHSNLLHMAGRLHDAATQDGFSASLEIRFVFREYGLGSAEVLDLIIDGSDTDWTLVLWMGGSGHLPILLPCRGAASVATWKLRDRTKLTCTTCIGLILFDLGVRFVLFTQLLFRKR